MLYDVLRRTTIIDKIDESTVITRTKHQELTRWIKRLLVSLLPVAILVSLLPVAGQQASAQLTVGDLAFVLLDGTTPYSTATQQLEAAGARIQHVFPPNALIGQVSPNLAPDVLKSAGVTVIYRKPVNLDELTTYSPPAQRASRAWNDLLASFAPLGSASQITVAQAGADLVGDALMPPDLPPDGQTMTAAGSGDGPNCYQTSEFMIGSVAVGIILPESDGSIDPSTEDWSEEEHNQVYSEIVAATNWWATQEPAAHLTFVYDDHSSQPIPTSYEPISRPQSDQGLWIGEVMGKLGYNEGATPYFTRVRDYVNDLREIHQTDWAFAIFVVDSSNDADNYFATGYFAYAYLGGPFTVMTYGNNGYGIHNMDAVAAHEMGHIFLTLDQYSAARVPCTRRAGYLDVETQNSLYGSCALNESSIMRGQVWPYTNGAIDHYARGQIGWWDSDGDGVLDPVDTSTEVTLTQEAPPEAGQTLTYLGTARDIPLPSTRRRTTTINRITSMAYRLDGGDWRPASPADADWDSFKESFTIALPPLSEGIYQLDLLVHTSLGGDRIVSAADVVVVSAPGSNAPLQELEDLPSPTTDDTPTYTGLAAAVNGTIAAVEFRTDGKAWQPAEAADDRFDQAIEAFSFTTPALSVGLHTIEVRATDFEGRITNSCCSDTLEVLETHAVYLPVVTRNQ